MSSVRRDRSTPSCARCYRMKKKCDKKVPSCSRCTLAGAQCLAIHRSAKTELPRSAVQYLERCLSQAVDGTLGINSQQSNDDRIPPGRVQDLLLRTAAISLGFFCTSQVLQNDQGIHYHARLFYASERPPLKIPVRGIYVEEPPRKASQGAIFRPQQLAAQSIPSQVTTRLFDHYCKNVLPIYPCFTESDLSDQFRKFYSMTDRSDVQSSNITCFVVSMILAISSLNSKSNDTRKVASLSESLQRDALMHASFLANTDLRSLQCLTLLTQMALWLPYTANLWYLSGEMMRMAIALGLHQQAESLPDLDPTHVRLRQELFWTVYRLERTIAMASGCPLAISDEHITAPIPPSTISHLPDRSLNQRKALHRFSSQVQLSQLQSEIHGVQFFDQILPDDATDYDDWLQKAERSIQAWEDNLTFDGVTPEWACRAADRCRLLLYRPCSRKIAPTESALQTACIVAIRTIDSYWRIVQKGGLIFSFTDVSDTFQASMILIYVVGDGSTLALGSELEKRAHQALERLEPLFTGLATRWPAVTDTAYYVGELKNAVLRDMNAGDIIERRATDERLLAELDFMVTQRRIHSIYHRNIDTSMLGERIHTWPSPENFSTLGEELWQAFFDENFHLPNDEFLTSGSMAELQLVFPWNDGISTASETAHEAATDGSLDIDLLMRSVPACGYCRTRHVKCDQQYPSCGACTRSNRACVYYDPVLQIDILRSYVFNLYERYQRQLLELKKSTLAPTTLLNQDTWYNVLLPVIINEFRNTSDNSSKTTWYFGPGSFLSYLRRAASLRPVNFLSQVEERLSSSLIQEPILEKCSTLPQSLSSTLFHVFSNSINTFYPTLHDRQLSDLLRVAYKQEGTLADFNRDIFYLILANGSAMATFSDGGPAYTPHVYFQEALHHPERSRADWLSINPLCLLQRQLLICLFIMFNPSSGDIWRNLGFAIRLYLDLSHRPSEHDDMDEILLAMLFRTLYCLESHVAIAFGRPSLLIIGDKIREEMTKHALGTLSECVGIWFYRISFLKLQIHSRMCPGSSKRSLSSIDGKFSESHQKELEAWLTDFRVEVLPTIQQDSVHGENLGQLLETWATLQYHQTAFLLSQIRNIGIHDAQLHCEELFNACSFLIRHQHKSPLLRRCVLPLDWQSILPVYPLSWTIPHSIFSASLDLIVRLQSGVMDLTALQRTARRSVTTLALLESNPAMLSTGFSEILEDFWSTMQC